MHSGIKETKAKSTTILILFLKLLPKCGVYCEEECRTKPGVLAIFTELIHPQPALSVHSEVEYTYK